MQQDIFSKMESLKDSDFISVGEVKEDDFLNDIESAVNTGSGAPPKVEKTDGQETEAPSSLTRPPGAANNGHPSACHRQFCPSRSGTASLSPTQSFLL